MSEAEAKTKWCLRGPAPSSSEHCIGAECMAWRGRLTDDFKARAEAEYRHRGGRLKPTGDDVDGFCGLAGQP